MIIKLLPEQVVKFWDMLRYAIAETFMPRNSCTNQHLQHILASLLAGKTQCWMAFKDVEGERKFIGFIVTRIGSDPAIGELTLFIDCIYAFQTVPEEIMFNCQGILEKFAVKNSCKSIVAMTEADRIATLAKRNGYSQRYYLYKEVPNG